MMINWWLINTKITFERQQIANLSTAEIIQLVLVLKHETSTSHQLWVIYKNMQNPRHTHSTSLRPTRLQQYIHSIKVSKTFWSITVDMFKTKIRLDSNVIVSQSSQINDPCVNIDTKFLKCYTSSKFFLYLATCWTTPFEDGHACTKFDKPLHFW